MGASRFQSALSFVVVSGAVFHSEFNELRQLWRCCSPSRFEFLFFRKRITHPGALFVTVHAFTPGNSESFIFPFLSTPALTTASKTLTFPKMMRLKRARFQVYCRQAANRAHCFSRGPFQVMNLISSAIKLVSLLNDRCTIMVPRKRKPKA